jgi:hypothetical protein
VNVAQKAHIYAFSAHGPRGHAGIAEDVLNGLDNLFLVCHQCHRKIDTHEDGGRYAADLLRRMKREHEQRTERVTAIDPSRQSHVLLYGANIGENSSPLNYQDAALALFPNRYPASDLPIDLTTVNSAFHDRTEEFWRIEAMSLQTKFAQRVRERTATGEVAHLSVFALAPQPLLILLGTLLGEIVPADIFQRHREPATWEWPASATELRLTVHPPTSRHGAPALVIALSATITPDRVTAVLGPDASIWTLTVDKPHNDLIKSRTHLAQLRSTLRQIYDEIKAVHGHTTTLHVFPACAVSAAVELGRVRMPKADMPWHIYDEVRARGGFIPALALPNGAHA